MSATTVSCLKRKRDWSDAREDDDEPAPVRLLRSTLPPASKRPRCIVDLTSKLAGNDDESRHIQQPKRKPLAPISSCRYESPRQPTPPSPAPTCMEETGHEQEEAMSEVEPSTTTSCEDIEPTPSTEPIESESASQQELPFGFDTTLSNVQYGFLRSRPYRFSSPLAPQPELRRRAKSRRSSRSKAPTCLLKNTLHRNHLISLRQRFPELFMPRSPTHPDAIPQLDDGDDDEFDDDEEDEIIDDFDDDNSQVDDIVNLYSARGATPEPESEPMVPKEAPISLPETILQLQTPSPKPRPRPLQPSNVLNIRPAELAPPKLSLITCEVVG